jgi:6-pyruvoyltetrahydropterin/6-carboxytetrahydropterin synthase
MSNYFSTKIIELGSCAFRQWRATHSHCQYLHGYQLKAKFIFGGSALDEKNWVVDFGGLKELKAVLQKQFDHTLCVAADDPALNTFKQLHDSKVCDLRIMPEGVGIEKTAEWCFKAADQLIKQQYGDRCWVESVEVFEHEANSAIYKRVQTATYSMPAPVTNDTRVLLNEEKETVTLPSATETPEAVEVKPLPEVKSNAAVVGRGKVTTGWSNPFGGTSWGV